MAKKKLIYVSSPYTGAVVEGQVYELLEYYKRQGWFSEVLLLQSYAGDADRHKGEAILKKFTFRKKFFWMNPYYPFYCWRSVINMRRVMKGEVDYNTVFHVRGGLYAVYVRRALSNRYKDLFILDEFRGFLSDELDYTGKKSFFSRIKNRIRKSHIEKCNKILQTDKQIEYTAVSPYLRFLESDKEGFEISKISVHPNIAANYFVFDSQKRKEIRSKLGVPDEKLLIVTSSGESGAWQKDIDVIDILTSKGYVVLNLSRMIIDKPNVISRFVPHNEMPSYLSACDAALLWREDRLLNKAASPSKFSEFACMGLYTIHNGSVDLVTHFIIDSGCGQIVNSPEEIDLSIAEFSDETRTKRCQLGKDQFSINVIAQDYYRLLTKGGALWQKSEE